jgi:hypothetical protein
MTHVEDIPVVFVSGPYSAKSGWEVECNIRRAEELALKVWELGAAVICPHTNARFFNGVCSEAVFIEGDLALLYRCDALITTDDWERSVGARGEIEFCKVNNILVFHALGELEIWIKKYKKQMEELRNVH